MAPSKCKNPSTCTVQGITNFVHSLNVNGHCSDDFDDNSTFGDACDDKCHDDNGRL